MFPDYQTRKIILAAVNRLERKEACGNWMPGRKESQ